MLHQDRGRRYPSRSRRPVGARGRGRFYQPRDNSTPIIDGQQNTNGPDRELIGSPTISVPSFNQERNVRPQAPGRFNQRGRSSARPNYRRPRESRQILSENNDSNSLIRSESDRDVQPKDESDTLNVQSQIAEVELRGNDFECIICCDNIRRTNPIWYCDSCYNIFHLKCAIEWCNKSIRSRNEAIADSQYPSLGQTTIVQNIQSVGNQSHGRQINYQAERFNSVEWPCPTCREVCHQKPEKYKCFCGKVVRPEINRLLTPHSCGQLCGRKRPSTDCPHSCNSVCHPGRCNPCSLTSRRPCHCGKLTRDIKCILGTQSCGQTCGKPMSCGRHFCSRICHSGSCEKCEEMLIISCNCGQEEVQKQCNLIGRRGGKKDLLKFSCKKVCGKLLDCSKHYCDQICHPGPNCRSCKWLSQNIKTCPCGSTHIKKSVLEERKSCMDPIPTCGNKCNAVLICGPEKNRHKCQKKCHVGPCPPCKLKTPAHCECGLSTKTIDCSLMFERIVDGDQVTFKQIKYTFTCETRCNKLKNCGRHRCNNKCCKFMKEPHSIVHNCDQICNKKLPCGLHNCQEPCHPGQCGDCTNIGWEELRCHCGLSVLFPPIPCGARPPACHRLCRRTHNCGHPVKHECHDDTEDCAPCTVFVKKSCFCGVDSKDSVHCYLPGYSCGRTCKKQLPCKQHTCKRVCHDGECVSANERGVILCEQPCPVMRYSCKHPCSLPCHGNRPCPPSECKKPIEITCDCGNKKERIDCYKIMKDVDNRNKVAMMSTNRNNQDSIIVDLSKKSIPKIEQECDSRSLKQLECDETCSILKRNKALAEALEITQPDLKPTDIFGEDPLKLLREATNQDYKFVSATFSSLARFVKAAKESDKRFIFMQFPPSIKLRREVIHELAHHFKCTSESRDEEPFRHVVVRAYKNKSAVPDFSIEQLLPIQ